MGWIVGRTVVTAAFVLASNLVEGTLDSGSHLRFHNVT